jgi:signal transduction histidine kinase
LFRGDGEGSKASQEDELRLMGRQLRSLMSDVTDTRSRLQRSHDRLQAAEKLASVGKLAASVAHEIRNPLTAVKMWLFSIRDTVGRNADVDRKFGIVSEEIARLEGIIRHFLEFSRPPTIRSQRQDVGRVVGNAVELLELRLKEKKICVAMGPTTGLPAVMADADQLKQVFINLLNNAIDAMTEGGEIRITSISANDADGRPMVVVRVADTGPGMPEDIRNHIFEPFFTTKDTGTGLGLCIAAHIMDRHGGLLVLESSTEKGTVFAVWTPTLLEHSDGQNPGS